MVGSKRYKVIFHFVILVHSMLVLGPFWDRSVLEWVSVFEQINLMNDSLMNNIFFGILLWIYQ